MKNYNIYIGLKNKGLQYQFTGLYENESTALEEAYLLACKQYDLNNNEYYSWKNAITDYCCSENIDSNDIDEEDLKEIENYYNDEREDWIEYNIIPTDEDDQEELIFDCDSFS